MKKLMTCLIIAASVTNVHAATGKEVYEKTCIACHGANGKGAVPGAADFTDPKGRLAKPDDVLLKHINNGFQTPGSPMAMPAKGGNPTLSDDDLKNALKYIRETYQPKKK